MTLSPEETTLITIASTFLIATLSIIMVIYALQVNYFNSKGAFRGREEEIRLKDATRYGTLYVFKAELEYVLFALAALFLNAMALAGLTDVRLALLVSFLIAVVFVVLVTEEFASSIMHLEDRKYAKEPEPEEYLPIRQLLERVLREKVIPLWSRMKRGRE